MNTIQVMRKTQRLARSYLESKGATVYIKPHSRYDKDIFGLFDGLVITSDKKTFWLQVKTGYCDTKQKEAIYQWSVEYKQKAMIMEYMGRNRWRILQWEHDI